MYCVNCGTKIADGSSRCPNCGHEAGTDRVEGNNKVSNTSSQDTGDFTLKSEKKKTCSKKMILCIGVVILVLIAIVAFGMNLPKKINLEEYVELGCYGYNGYATADVNVKWMDLYSDIYEAIGGKSDSVDDIDSIIDTLQGSYEIAQLINSISINFSSEREYLSNGDLISVDITYDNELTKKSKIKFTGESVSMTVENLVEVEQIDPFENLEVVFSGISPQGTIEYSYQGNDDRIFNLSFSVSQSEQLKNGDTVLITVDADDKITGQNGYICIKKSEEYMVEGLDEYVSSFENISEDFLSKMKTEAEDSIYAYTASDYKYGVSLSSDLSYAGYMMNFAKGDYYSQGINNVYLIFSGVVSDTDGDFGAAKVYYPVRFSNILKTENGLSYEENMGITGNSRFDDSNTGTKGYINPLQFYTEVIDANRDNYESQIGDGFEVLSNSKDNTGLYDINNDLREKLYERALALVADYNVNHQFALAGETVMDNLTVAGEYLLLFKNPGTDYSKNNKYFVVCSANVSNRVIEPATVYYPVEFDGLINFSNGESIISRTEGIQGYSYFVDHDPNWAFDTSGYIDGTKMFAEIVTVNRDNYTYEVSDGLKQFGE